MKNIVDKKEKRVDSNFDWNAFDFESSYVAIEISQGEIAEYIGILRQTYCVIEI